MNVALLTPERIQAKLLISNLQKHGINLTLVMFYQRDKSHKHSIKVQIKSFIKHYLLYFSNEQKIKRQIALNNVEANNMFNEYIKQSNFHDSASNDTKIVKVSNVNGQKVIDLNTSHQIDYLLISGIPIIKEHIIKSVKLGVINAHSSILPEYRGTKAEFWQFYNQDFNYAGITLHLVDTGVDTGDILYQKKADDSKFKNPEILRVANSICAIEAFPAVLKSIERGDLNPISQKQLPQNSTKTYRIKDIRAEHLAKVYLKG